MARPNGILSLGDVELPCDWTVNRRPIPLNHGPVHTAADLSPSVGPSQPSSSSSKPSKRKPDPNHNNNNHNNNQHDHHHHHHAAASAKKKRGAPRSLPPVDEDDHHRHAEPPSAAPPLPTVDDERQQHSSSSSGGSTEETAEDPTAILPHPLGPVSSTTSRPSLAAADYDDDDEGQVRKGGGARIKGMILNHLKTAAANEEEQLHHLLDTEGLLSRLPYRKMLSDMFGGSLRGNLRSPTIPYVTRAYEEAFMREPTHSSERECANGKRCECMFIDRGQAFVGVEFLLPGEALPRTPHLCVLCSRATTQQLYYDVMFDKTDFPGTIQRFGNIHSQPDEYALDAMLIAMPTAPVHIMPLPIVSHQRNRYLVYVSGGIRRLRQSRVYFQSTPSCSADGGI